ncbi:hypothetical protein ACIPZC_25830 [Pseudomonas sp. NPDC089743]|uniref:hypothetical protein n=1 Tax=Pseudomonas sp. NPDC089743 TaxID=3364471 RepID=UPI00382D4B2A
MRIFIAALGLAVLVGCATVDDIRANTPLVSVQTSKPADEVAECIRDGWQGIALIGGSVGGVLQRSGSRLTVVAPNAESPWHVVDVFSAGTGKVQVTYRFYRTWQSPNEKVMNVVKECAG